MRESCDQSSLRAKNIVPDCNTFCLMQGQNFKRTLFPITSSDSSNTLPTLLQFCSMLPKCVKGAGYWLFEEINGRLLQIFELSNNKQTIRKVGSLLDESLEVTESYTLHDNSRTTYLELHICNYILCLNVL